MQKRAWPPCASAAAWASPCASSATEPGRASVNLKFNPGRRLSGRGFLLVCPCRQRKQKPEGKRVWHRVAVVTGGTRGIGAGDLDCAEEQGLSCRRDLRRQRCRRPPVPGRDGHSRLQVGCLRLRRLREGRRRRHARARSDRRARQQRRHHARRHAASHDQGELGRGDAHQSRLGLQHDASTSSTACATASSGA